MPRPERTGIYIREKQGGKHPERRRTYYYEEKTFCSSKPAETTAAPAAVDKTEAAKAAPGQLKACTEVGAYTYYELLAFEKAADIDLDLVDVGSNSDKIAAMLSGQVDLMPGAYINCKDYLESGQFNCIGAPTEERYDLIKDIPTLKEQGVDLVYPDCDFSFYFPADTSDDVIAYYEDLVQKVLADPSAAEGVANVDMMPYYLNAEDSAKNDEQIYNTIKEIADSLEQ